MRLRSILTVLAALFIATACEIPTPPPENIGAIRGFVIIGSMPVQHVAVTLDDGIKIRCTDQAGEYRFPDLIVGESHTVSVKAPTQADMHVSEHIGVVVPDTHVAYPNFFGSRLEGYKKPSSCEPQG